MTKRAFRLDDRRPFKRDFYRIVKGPEIDPDPLEFSGEPEGGWTLIAAGVGLALLASVGFVVWAVLEAVRVAVR